MLKRLPLLVEYLSLVVEYLNLVVEYLRCSECRKKGEAFAGKSDKVCVRVDVTVPASELM